MSLVRLDEIINSNDSNNVARLYHLVTWLITSRTGSEHSDIDFISLLGLVQSHLLRVYPTIALDSNLVDWESSQKAMLASLATDEPVKN